MPLVQDSAVPAKLASTAYDVVVYKANPAGIVAAIVASRMGARVALVEHTARVGGIMSQGGLTATDLWFKTTIGGVPWQLFQQWGKLEGGRTPNFAGASTSTSDDFIERPQPKNTEIVFRRVLAQSSVDLYLNARLESPADVLMSGLSIRALRTSRGDIRGRIFIDCSYEGDVLRGSGVPYSVGREASSLYGESYGGVYKSAPTAVSINLLSGGVPLYPLVADHGLAAGAADSRVQAYSFRATIKDRATGAVRDFMKPRNYDPTKFEIIRRFANSGSGATALTNFISLGAIKGDKFVINAGSGYPISNDLENQSGGYPEGTWTQREAIYRAHKHWTMGLLWTAANDPAIPAAARADAQRYGYPIDEYTDNEGFPHEMYVREAARMTGAMYVTRQSDFDTNKTKTNRVAKFPYILDCHAPAVLCADANNIVKDGGLYVSQGSTGQIPMTSLIPDNGYCTNLVVPVCAGFSHVAWAPFRMEPGFMSTGEAAGVMAAAAARKVIAVQDISHTADVLPVLSKLASAI